MAEKKYPITLTEDGIKYNGYLMFDNNKKIFYAKAGEDISICGRVEGGRMTFIKVFTGGSESGFLNKIENEQLIFGGKYRNSEISVELQIRKNEK